MAHDFRTSFIPVVVIVVLLACCYQYWSPSYIQISITLRQEVQPERDASKSSSTSQSPRNTLHQEVQPERDASKSSSTSQSPRNGNAKSNLFRRGALQNAGWAANGSLIIHAHTYFEVAMLEAMRSCLQGKVIVFIGDSVFRYVFWAAVHWLCQLMPSSHCSQLPPPNFARYRCTKFVARLGDDLLLVYVNHHYGKLPSEVSSSLNLTFDLVVWNSGIWFDFDKSSESFILDMYRGLFTEALRQPTTALLAAHTTRTARGGKKGNLIRQLRFNELLEQAFQSITNATQQHHIAILPWGWPMGDQTNPQHLQPDRVHPKWYSSVLMAQVALQSASHILCGELGSYDLAIDQTLGLSDPPQPKGFTDGWCSANLQTR